MSNDALLKVIGIIGSRKVLAAKLCVSVDRITSWLNKEIGIPLEYARLMELITNGAVTCESLAPHRMRRIPKEWKSQFFNQSFSTQTSRQFISIEDLLRPNFQDQDMLNQFSISEKVKMGLRLEEKLKHQGQRTDLQKQLVQNFGQVKPHQKTYRFVSERLGFGNSESYRQAKLVFLKGCAELIEAVDKQKMTIFAAVIVTKLTLDEQKKLLLKEKKEMMAIIKELRQTKGN